MKSIFFTLIFFVVLFSAQSQSFTPNLLEAHYFFLLPTAYADMPELGAALAEYNSEYHNKEELEVSTVAMILDKKTILYQVEVFYNEERAMAYYKGLEKRFADAIAKENATYYFFISKSNLNEVLKAKSLKAYKTFFAELMTEG